EGQRTSTHVSPFHEQNPSISRAGRSPSLPAPGAKSRGGRTDNCRGQPTDQGTGGGSTGNPVQGGETHKGRRGHPEEAGIDRNTSVRPEREEAAEQAEEVVPIPQRRCRDGSRPARTEPLSRQIWSKATPITPNRPGAV